MFPVHTSTQIVTRWLTLFSTNLILLFLFPCLLRCGTSWLSMALLKEPDNQVDPLGACIKQDDVLLVPISQNCLQSFAEGDGALPCHYAVSNVHLRCFNLFYLIFTLLLIIGGCSGKLRFFFPFGLWLPVLLNFAMPWRKAHGRKCQSGTLVLSHSAIRCKPDNYSSMSVIYCI